MGSEPSRSARGFDPRAVIDVGLLLAFGFLVASQIPRLLVGLFGVESNALITLITQGSFILVIWALLAWRNLDFSHIGLRRPERLGRAAWMGAILFVPKQWA